MIYDVSGNNNLCRHMTYDYGIIWSALVIWLRITVAMTYDAQDELYARRAI